MFVHQTAWINQSDRIPAHELVEVIPRAKGDRVLLGPGALGGDVVAGAELVPAGAGVEAAALEEVDPGKGAGGEGGPGRVQDGDCAVGVVLVALLDGAGGVDQGGDVAVGVLLGVEADAGGDVDAQDEVVDVAKAPDVLIFGRGRGATRK